MKFFRLHDTDIRYGLAGNVIPYDIWHKIAYIDKPLYREIDSSGTGFPYKVEIKQPKQGLLLFYLESYADIVILLNRIADRVGTRPDKLPLIVPRTSVQLDFVFHNFNIIYRKEWDEEQQGTSSSTKKATL